MRIVVVSDDQYRQERADRDGWHKISDSPEFVKWQYKDSPYRVIADLGDRGHWRALFASVYGPPNYLIRGNCGGGTRGRMVAVGAAKQFMRENARGCPPPSDYK
jgi:hypothetical protein